MAAAEDQTGAPPEPLLLVAPEPPARKGGRGRAMARHAVRHTWRFVTLWILAGSGFALVFAGLLIFALADGPVKLPSWMASRIEAALNLGLPAGHVSLREVQVDLNRGRAPRVRLRDVGLFDDRGAEVARLNEVSAAFSLPALLRGHRLPGTLRLSGAQMVVRRDADGAFDLSFGSMGAVAGSLPEILDRIDRLFAAEPLSAVERIEASELTITLEDARSARIWQVTDGTLTLVQNAGALQIGVDFDVFNGTEALAHVGFTFRSEKGSPAARVEVRFSNAASGDIALQSPALAFLSVIDAPIGGALEMSVDTAGALGDFTAELDIGAGTLSPGREIAEPMRIGGGSLRLSFDPAAGRLDFQDLTLRSEKVGIALEGQTYMRDLGPDGWPASFVGQFRILGLSAQDPALLAAPLNFDAGLVEVKLALRPFALSLGQLRLADGATSIGLSGHVAAVEGGADIAFDLDIDRIAAAHLLDLWPLALADRTRDWVAQNVVAGDIENLRIALRRRPGQARPDLAMGFDFSGAETRYLPGFPPLHAASGYASLADYRFVVQADGGTVTAPEGGDVDVAGTLFTVPDTRTFPAPARIDIAASGPITAVLSLLDLPPLQVMQKAGRPVDVASGRAVISALVETILKKGVKPEEIAYSARAVLSGVTSDQLVPGRRLAAERLLAATDGKTIEIRGPVTLGKLPAQAVWRAGIGPESAQTPARVEAELALGPAFMSEFGIGLSRGMVSGDGLAKVEIELPRDDTPSFRLSSDLRGLSLRIDAVGWSKPAGSSGSLEVSGRFGSPPKIDRIEISGGGLTASGSVSLTASGGLEAARFDRVRISGWLDAPLVLTGRGSGAVPAISVRGGTLDFRKAGFGDGASAAGGGPVTVALDRLIVSEGIVLTGFRGDFTTRGGFGGTFSAKLNGGGTLNGTVVPQQGGSALRVTSQDAGDVLRDAGVAQRVRGGAMELVLVPTGKRGYYDGSLTASHVRVRGTPALAELLNAVSIIGLLQQLNGDGIVFDDVQVRFLLGPTAIDVLRASAIGASMGISARGRYTLGSGALDIRGVFSPLFLLNGIGQIFSRKGEGLFGFNYRVQGTSEDPKVSVNPLSILTPGMFREIFQAPPPKP